MFLTHSSMTGLRVLAELTSPYLDAATAIFNLPDYRVVETGIPGFGQRRINAESTTESGCPACGVIGTRRHSRRPPAPEPSRESCRLFVGGVVG
jgi:hypothetical protein